MTLLTATKDLDLSQAAVLAGLLQETDVAARYGRLPGPGRGRLALARVVTCCQAGDAQAGLDERVQPVGGDRRPHPAKRPPHQPQVQRTDDVLMVLGHLTERALAEAQPVLPAPSPASACGRTPAPP